MQHKTLKLSEIKQNIRYVLENLQQLEHLTDNDAQDFNAEQAEELQRSTTTLLDALDQVPVAKVAGIQKQRRRRRRLDKQKKKEPKLKAKKAKQGLQSKPKVSFEPSLTSREQQAEHISLKKRHDAASILHTLDLLEKLCKSRGGDKLALSQKLAQMRVVWRRVQQENEGDHDRESQKRVSSIESQWQAVFFGQSSDFVRENKETFCQRRSIWDSYISYGQRASCIPRGWVLPPESAPDLWTEYRTA
ncbi:uncharacterized protein [Drosophila kikkawai]|uniref:Programmed cell death protein 7 n=1 Tax=Drosophila kikkawai TaxID=30033 RepID=A0ABM4GK62_DROKI|nr:uncharacterized protein LOC108084963 [Drosophila kikkawai]